MMLNFSLRFTVQSAFSVLLLIVFLIGFANAQTQPGAPAVSIQPVPTATAQKSDSPTNTVQAFYKSIRERRFRDALLMTNLRPAVEKLTAAELADLAPDFEPMATRVPEKIEVNGEQISGNLASVFVKSNDSVTGELKLDELKMRRENNDWIILTGDADTETEARREGANYFFKLRIETRHTDIEFTMQDIIKAELARSLQNKGEYADLQTLANEKLLSADVLNTDIMGYRFRSQISGDKKKYTVNAEPVQYGKTGKFSFLLTSGEGNNGPRIQKDDKNGAPITAKN